MFLIQIYFINNSLEIEFSHILIFACKPLNDFTSPVFSIRRRSEIQGPLAFNLIKNIKRDKNKSQKKLFSETWVINKMSKDLLRGLRLGNEKLD
jgi:hypothetical protein